MVVVGWVVFSGGEVGGGAGFALLFVVFVLRVRSYLFGASLDVVFCCAAGQIRLVFFVGGGGGC